MIEDLIFKGKSLDEALGKASNFFGVPGDRLKYEFVEETPEQEVWIQLTENPLMAQRKQEQETQEEVNHNRAETQPQHPREDSYHNRAETQPQHPQGQEQYQRKLRPQKTYNRPQKPQNRSTNRSGGYQQPPRHGGGDRRFKPNKGRFDKSESHRHPRNDNWKRSEPDLSVLNEAEREAHKFVDDMLRRMQLRAEVVPSQDQSRLIFNIDGPDRATLLNNKGEPLIAIQYLVNKIFMGKGSFEQPVYIDSQGYRIHRDEELQEIAVSGAEKVRRSGKEYSLSPMNPYERRMIHVALKDDDDVATISRGDGYIKRVSIVPADQAPEKPE